MGFNISDNKITPPSYRGDIKTPNDIAEEIARVVGYNNIKAIPLNIHKSTDNHHDYKLSELNIKKLLVEHGFFEVINYPFVNNKTANSIRVDNSLDSNREYLRTDLKNSLIDNLLYNEKRQQDSIKLFEISDVYFSSKEIKNKKMLGIICSGRVGKNYIDFSKKIDKSFLVNIFKSLSDKIEVNPILISRDCLDSKLNNKIVYLEIELNDLKSYLQETTNTTLKIMSYDSFIKYQPISNFPLSTRDISFAIKDINGYYEVQDFVLNYKHDLIKEIFVFDYYSDKKNNEIKLGIRIIFQSKQSTITEKQVNQIMQTIQHYTTSINGISIPGLKKLVGNNNFFYFR